MRLADRQILIVVEDHIHQGQIEVPTITGHHVRGRNNTRRCFDTLDFDTGPATPPSCLVIVPVEIELIADSEAVDFVDSSRHTFGIGGKVATQIDPLEPSPSIPCPL